MKKSLIALAVLAASGAAMAQSSVTLYGILDIGYADTNIAGQKFNQVSANHTPSRIGFRGTEDLGSGLKANFNLETGDLGLETGATNLVFNREAWVGLSGNFGATRFGRTSSIATKSYAAQDLNGISAATSALSNVGINPVTWYGSSRRSSQFQYHTNDFSGFSAGLGFTLKADPTGTTVAGNKNRTSLSLNYANGPLAAAFTAESAATNAAGARAAYALAGAYDFGVAKVNAGYVRSENSAVTQTGLGANDQGGKGFHLGVVAPFGAAKVGAQYARNTTSKDAALELFANYALSKRTTLYTDIARVNNKVGADVNKFGVGVLHAF